MITKTALGINSCINHYNIIKFINNNKNKLNNIMTNLYENIITGERIQQLADIYLGYEEDFIYNPLIHKDYSKHLDIKTINKNFNNPSIIFCYTRRIKDFSFIIDYFKNDFILISHNCDENIVLSDFVNKILDYPNLKKWYTQNLMISHSKISSIPIGVANSQWPHGQLAIFNNINYNKSKKVFFNFYINTNRTARNLCYEKLKDKITFLPSQNFQDYIKNLSEYEFCICPEGNGIDTHRLWECVYLQIIPIVVRNPFITIIEKEFNIPIFILESWDDFDINKLPDYKTFINNLSYFDKLSMKYLRKKINYSFLS